MASFSSAFARRSSAEEGQVSRALPCWFLELRLERPALLAGGVPAGSQILLRGVFGLLPLRHLGRSDEDLDRRHRGDRGQDDRQSDVEPRQSRRLSPNL